MNPNNHKKERVFFVDLNYSVRTFYDQFKESILFL